MHKFIYTSSIKREEEDKLIWKGDTTGEFSV